MEKMKPILPSLKEKKRYIAFEIISERPIDRLNIVSRAVWKACLSNMGELGVSRAGLWVVPDTWNGRKQRGLIRANNRTIHEVKASLAYIRKINRQDVVVRSLGMSGMLKKAYENYVQ
jgi:ribonuclease P/MRP protein subunit POP5